MQRIALLGITGRAGSRIASELLARGHRVTGIARNTSDTQAQAGLTLQSADASRADAIAPLLQGHDVVVSATRFDGGPTADVLLAAVREAGVRRLLVVGGAGSLEVAPGQLLVDSPSIPDHVKPESRAGVVFLDILRREQGLDWTFLSPAGMFVAGERTGKFRLGGDQLLKDANGDSRISYEDYAVAMVDELERPTHSCHRFTLAY